MKIKWAYICNENIGLLNLRKLVMKYKSLSVQYGKEFHKFLFEEITLSFLLSLVWLAFGFAAMSAVLNIEIALSKFIVGAVVCLLVAGWYGLVCATSLFKSKSKNVIKTKDI